jgi:hypothetical protein
MYDDDDAELTSAEVTGRLSLCHSDGWYTVERAEHENRYWVEETEYEDFTCGHLVYSGRVSDADVEGTASEMRGLAGAIRARRRFAVKRCAVRFDATHAYFWSPRNSRTAGRVALASADDLAAQIEALLGP